MLRRKNPQDSPTAEGTPALPPVAAPLEEVRLPPFSGDRRFCAKCGNAGAATFYVPPGRTCTHFQGDRSAALWRTERLHRVCRRCGFAWDEACVAPLREIRETLIMPAVNGGKHG